VAAQRPADPTLVPTAWHAFAAWQRLHWDGDPAPLRALLAPDFRYFQHPVRRDAATGPAARVRLEQFIARTRARPNRIRFTEVQLATNDTAAVFTFTSRGTVDGGTPYEGRNAIHVTVRGGRVTGIREYFGFAGY
jgi:ketosteroid isomerase-like protein